MNKDASAFFVVMVGTGINMLAAVQRGKDYKSTLFAGLAFGTICVGINTGTAQNAGTGLALVFLLSSFLRNGVRLVDTTASAIDSLGKV